LAISGGKGKAAIANHLHDHVDHVSVRQQSQQLVGEAAVPYEYSFSLRDASGILGGLNLAYV